jgi:hypothetical protein
LRACVRADIAWTYPEPKEKAAEIKGFVAFYVGKHDGEYSYLGSGKSCIAVLKNDAGGADL